MPIIPIDPYEPGANVGKTMRRNWLLPPAINVIGISGSARSGKDSVCTYLYSTFTETHSEAFAGPLKEAAAFAFGIPHRDFNDPERKELINPYWGVSPRMIAQFVGTEMFRDTIDKLLPNDHNDFWVRRMFGKLSGLQRHDLDGDYIDGDTVVIPDVRFQNEVDFVTDNGGIHIHLVREGATGNVGIENHPSEALNFSLTGERTYVLSNNGTLEELYAKVHQLVLANFKLTPYDITSDI